MSKIIKQLHNSGYVILPIKISIPKNIEKECRKLFSPKKKAYTFNGAFGETNDKKRYLSMIDTSTIIQTWLDKIHNMLETHMVISTDLHYSHSAAYVSIAGCKQQQPHSDYIHSPAFSSLVDHPKILQPASIKKGDVLLYTKNSCESTVTVTNIHLDDYPNFYYTVQMHDGSEKQTTTAYLSYPTEEEREIISRQNKIPLIILVSIMDHTTIDIWENSHNWMQLHDNESFDPPVVKKTITLEKGEICILRGDVIHAGTGYTKENIRLYSYYDSYSVMTNDNKVYMIDGKTQWEKEIIDMV
jgi:hypothetical protein